MKVGTFHHKGLEYVVELTGSDELGWGQHKNHFYATCGTLQTDFYKSFEEADNEMKSLIDHLVSNVPQNIDQLVSKLSELLVWTGYEDCELDQAAAKILINNYIEHVVKSRT